MVQISTGLAHTLASTADGNVYAWGSNPYGNIGDGTYTERLYPILVASNISKVSAGEVWFWGFGYRGQLGNGTPPSSSSIPLKAIFPEDGNIQNVPLDKYEELIVREQTISEAYFKNSDLEITDTLPPSRPTDLRIYEEIDGKVYLEWSESSDNHNVAGYHIYNRTELIATVDSNEAFEITHLLDENMILTIRAYDDAGNLSIFSRAALH